MDSQKGFLRPQVQWEQLYFYQKAKCLYSITFYFTQTFLQRGDRTIDQMVQAARSGKQNIVEGSAAGVTSTEMEIKLLNVARASIKELREDYEDYLNVRHLPIWCSNHPSFDNMLQYCRKHNQPEDYEPLLPRLTDEKIANMCITICHMVDKMMLSYQKRLEKQFVEEGGIRERMTAARLDCRNTQKAVIGKLEQKINQLEMEKQRMIAKIKELEQPLESSSNL